MSDAHDQTIIEAARRWRAATNDDDRMDAQIALGRAIDASETQPPAHSFKVGDWVAWSNRGYCVRESQRTGVLLEDDVGLPIWVDPVACLPIPPRPKPKHGWYADGVIVTKPCEAWWNPNGDLCVLADGNPPIVPMTLYGSRRWRAVRQVGPEKRDLPPIPATHYYPLFKHMSDEHGLTLIDSEMDEIVRVVESLKAEPAPEAPKPAATFRPFKDHIEARAALGRKVVSGINDGFAVIVTEVGADNTVYVGRWRNMTDLFDRCRYLNDDGTAGDRVGVREGGAE
jgi:hypothetical protein